MDQAAPKRGRPRKDPDAEKAGRRIKIWLPTDLERRLRAQCVRPGEQLGEAIARLLRAATHEND